MQNDFLKKLSENIVSIVNKKTNEITVGVFSINEYIDKYSSTKTCSLRLFVDDVAIRTKNYNIVYKCEFCEKSTKMHLKKFLLKKTLICRSCKELDCDKRLKHSIFMSNSFLLNGRICPINKKSSMDNSIDGIYNKGLVDFYNQTQAFKDSFYKQHITESEFATLRPFIFSICDVKLTSDYVFLETFKSNNQMLFTQKIYDTINDILLPLRNVKMVCSKCGKIFNISRLLKEKSTHFKIMCKDCSFCNKTFKIKTTNNILGETVKYQSSIEYKFICFFNDNRIVVNNGCDVKYEYINKLHTYRIDFYLPDYKMMIELKDDHIWHKNQVRDGIWSLKEKSAIQYCNEKGLQFKLIFSNDLKKFLSTFKI